MMQRGHCLFIFPPDEDLLNFSFVSCGTSGGGHIGGAYCCSGRVCRQKRKKYIGTTTEYRVPFHGFVAAHGKPTHTPHADILPLNYAGQVSHRKLHPLSRAGRVSRAATLDVIVVHQLERSHRLAYDNNSVKTNILRRPP